MALPHALFLDQASLSAICSRSQFAEDACPARSIYGHASASTPLLDKPLEGPVYLRSSTEGTPNLVAHLEGQVNIDLVGRIDSFHGGIRTTFDRVPDVPVTSFTLSIRGGKHGLLVATRNLCKGRIRGSVRIQGQNGRRANRKTSLRASCKRKSGKAKGRA